MTDEKQNSVSTLGQPLTIADDFLDSLRRCRSLRTIVVSLGWSVCVAVPEKWWIMSSSSWAIRSLDKVQRWTRDLSQVRQFGLMQGSDMSGPGQLMWTRRTSHCRWTAEESRRGDGGWIYHPRHGNARQSVWAATDFQYGDRLCAAVTHRFFD